MSLHPFEACAEQELPRVRTAEPFLLPTGHEARLAVRRQAVGQVMAR
jgi:hypothetical protein